MAFCRVQELYIKSESGKACKLQQQDNYEKTRSEGGSTHRPWGKGFNSWAIVPQMLNILDI